MRQAVDLVRERMRKEMSLKDILIDLFEQCLSPHPSANEVPSRCPPSPPSSPFGLEHSWISRIALVPFDAHDPGADDDRGWGGWLVAGPGLRQHDGHHCEIQLSAGAAASAHSPIAPPSCPQCGDGGR